MGKTLDDFKREIQNLDIDTSKVESVMAKVVLDKSQELVPVDKGDLRDSGHIEGSEVIYDSNHSIFVEFGTYKVAAQPFLRPAVDENEAEIVEAAAQEIQSQVKEKFK